MAIVSPKDQDPEENGWKGITISSGRQRCLRSPSYCLCMTLWVPSSQSRHSITWTPRLSSGITCATSWSVIISWATRTRYGLSENIHRRFWGGLVESDKCITNRRYHTATRIWIDVIWVPSWAWSILYLANNSLGRRIAHRPLSGLLSVSSLCDTSWRVFSASNPPPYQVLWYNTWHKIRYKWVCLGPSPEWISAIPIQSHSTIFITTNLSGQRNFQQQLYSYRSHAIGAKNVWQVKAMLMTISCVWESNKAFRVCLDFKNARPFNKTNCLSQPRQRR